MVGPANMRPDKRLHFSSCPCFRNRLPSVSSKPRIRVCLCTEVGAQQRDRDPCIRLDFRDSRGIKKVDHRKSPPPRFLPSLGARGSSNACCIIQHLGFFQTLGMSHKERPGKHEGCSINSFFLPATDRTSTPSPPSSPILTPYHPFFTLSTSHTNG